MPNTHEGNRRVRLRNIEAVYWAINSKYADNKWATIAQIVDWSALSRATVQRHLKTLAEQGRAEHNGKARYERKWRRI